jgi:hypothetical protein
MEDKAFAEVQMALEDGNADVSREALALLEDMSYADDGMRRDMPSESLQEETALLPGETALEVREEATGETALVIMREETDLLRQASSSSQQLDMIQEAPNDSYIDADEPIALLAPQMVSAPPPIVPERPRWYNSSGNPLPTIPLRNPPKPPPPPPRKKEKDHQNPLPLPPPPRKVADIGVAVTFSPKRGDEAGPSLPQRIRMPEPIRPKKTLVASVRPPEGIGPGRPGCPALSRPVAMTVADATQGYTASPGYVPPDDPTPPMTPADKGRSYHIT